MGPTAGARCLLCRRDATPAARKGREVYNNVRSCAASLCTVFGIPDGHPFRVLYEKAQYCEECLKELHEADVTLGKLELMRQSLLRFQNRIYSKLGDNYFQIKDRNVLDVSYVEFESGGEKMRGKKFTFDEIVKIVYEKLDKECFKWEKFSSEGLSDTVTSTSSCDASTQTNEGNVSLSNIAHTTSQAILPDLDDDPGWTFEGDDGNVSGTEGDDGTSTVTTSQNSSSLLPINFDEKHYCTHDPENCKRFFYDDYNLQIHIKSFHLGNDKPYECDHCKKGFIDASRLKYHQLRVHTPFGLYICEHCGKGFGTQTLLRNHVRKAHEKGEAVHPCYFCSAPFTCPDELTEHEGQHRANKSAFDCLYCSEHFTHSTGLKAHYALTHSEQTFKCDLCGKCLANENGLRLHRIMHTEAHKCDQCSYTGSSASALTNHMLSHSEDKPYTCEECGASYKWAKNLTAHRRVHTGEKPHICQVCGIAFRERSYLKRHEETHSAVFNYKCGTCGKEFKVRENLKKHMRLHNGYKKKSRPKGSPSRPRVRKSRAKKKRAVTETGEVDVKLNISDTPDIITTPFARKSPSRGKQRDNSPHKKSKGKKNKGKRKRKHEEDFEEVFEGVPRPQVEIETYGHEMTQDELTSAVASIQGHHSMHPRSTTVYTHSGPAVYANQLQPASTVQIQEFIPVTVINAQPQVQGSESSGARGRPQVQYQFGYNI